MRASRTASHLAPLASLAAAALVGCAGGPRIEARPQVIIFEATQPPAVGQVTATVAATASSGLPVRFDTSTPGCSVDPASGLVTRRVSGTCTIVASQPGDAHWDAAPRATVEVTFTCGAVLELGAAPALAVHDRGTLSATERGGATVAFRSDTPATCAVEAGTGLVVALAEGDCVVVVTAGTASATSTLRVSAAVASAPPGPPAGVTATEGATADTAEIRLEALAAGGHPITGYTAASVPPGVTGAGAELPVRVVCPSPCASYRFTLAATNELGSGPASAPGGIITRFDVVATFREPDTQPNDTIFVGSFLFDASVGAVSGLSGELSESMTGGPIPYPADSMTWVPLEHQLSAVPVTLDGVEGWLVTSFHLDTTDTLSQDPRYGGTDGWAPGSGMGLHFGYPGANPGNAYVRIFVPAADPTAALSPVQIAALAYADCAPGGMMGASCMTGTSPVATGTAGTMGGYPLSQVVTRN